MMIADPTKFDDSEDMSDVLQNEEYGLGDLPPAKVPTAQDLIVKAVNHEVEDSFAQSSA